MFKRRIATPGTVCGTVKGCCTHVPRGRASSGAKVPTAQRVKGTTLSFVASRHPSEEGLTSVSWLLDSKINKSNGGRGRGVSGRGTEREGECVCARARAHGNTCAFSRSRMVLVNRHWFMNHPHATADLFRGQLR